MVRTRMAPSPTGEYHIGHIRTLLFNYAYAKGRGGKFIIRIEDTDRERLVPQAQERILSVIKDFGFSWDEGPGVGGPYAPYIQSKRLPIYKKFAFDLIDKGYAYFCFCSKERLRELRKKCEKNHVAAKYDRKCLNIPLGEARERAKKEPFVIRMKVPDNEQIEYDDMVLGKVSVSSSDLDDQVLLKSDGFPTYHLAVVVDDHLMKISHILRGVEWVSSTPKHVLLYRYFGWKMPKIGHLPVLLNPSGKGKLSKRMGAVSARSFLERGYLPEAILNFLALLGWHPKDDIEVFSLKKFIKEFDIKDINKANPVFDLGKLDYFNKVYIRSLSDKKLYERLIAFDPSLKKYDKKTLMRVLSLEKERMKTLAEFKDLASFFFEDKLGTPCDKLKMLLVPKGRTPKEIRDHLAKVKDDLSSVSAWDIDNLRVLESNLKDMARRLNWKVIDVFMPIRVAVTGRIASPPLFETIEILGREKTLKRIEDAILLLDNRG